MESSTFLTTTSLDQRKQSSSPKRSPKQKKKTTMTSTMNKPIKVRYISNPMRVKICASKFRELVQELTGQDAVDLQPEEEEEEEEPVFVSDNNPSPPQPPPEEEDLVMPRVLHQEPLDDRVLVDYYQPLDSEETFLPQVSAGFSEFFSNGFYYVNDYGRIDSM